MTSNAFEFHSSLRFKVVIGNMTYAAFTEFRLPSLSVQTQTLQEGGQNQFVHKLPIRVDVGTASLKRGITTNLELLGWYEQVLKGQIKDAMRQVSVVMFDTTRSSIITWTLRDAYPIKWSGPTLQSGSGSVAIEELELVHHGFEFET